MPHSRSRSALALALLFVAGLGALEPVEARHRGIHRYRAGREADAPPAEEKKPAGPLFAIVSLADQHVSFYDANGLWARSAVSTGVDDHPTPAGIFAIMEKERWHRSNIYSGAPMPYMQRLTWTGVAMHEGHVTGRPASHGCIRLPGAFAKRLFSITNEGQRVIVSHRDVSPAGIAHAHLPKPRLTPPPGTAPEDKAAAGKPGKAVETVVLDNPAALAKAAAPAQLNPQEYARALKAEAAKAASAAQAKKAALADVDGKYDEARKAERELAAAESALRKARDEFENENRAAGKAEGEGAVKEAAKTKSAAEEKLAAAVAKVKEASDTRAAKYRDLASLEQAIKDADGEAEAASAALKDASTRQEPVSIFISRKTGRLYARQATKHLFDVPIAIRDPERPIGSHLFIATRAGEDGASLRWVVVTPPAAVEVKRRPHSSRRGRRFEPQPEERLPAAFPETASAALDRIEIPPEAAQRIAERLWVGATLIVSDVGMSGEGRYAMDFMILARTPVREE
jgi:hypothetical protein